MLIQPIVRHSEVVTMSEHSHDNHAHPGHETRNHSHDDHSSHHKQFHLGHGGHSHAPANFDRAFLVGMILNGGFVLTEFTFGFMANSVALIADAGHNLSDVLGLLLAWIASILVRRQPSKTYTYGWRKISILAALFNSIFLLVASGGIILEAIQRLFKPSDVQGSIVIIVAAIGVIINTLTALMFMSGRKFDLNIRAAFQHMAADAIVSVGVVLAGIGILWTHWLWLDPVFSLLISLFIIFSTWELLRDSFHLAIDGVPHSISEQEVRRYLADRTGVSEVHDLHIWSMSTVEIALTAHLVTPGGHPGDEFLSQVCGELRDRFGIQHSTIQIELGDQNCPIGSSCQP
jgi:cobalt-zinc-cadmium efflux system protein